MLLIFFEEAKPVLAADSGPKFFGDGGAADCKLDSGWRKKGGVGVGCQNFVNLSVASKSALQFSCADR
jgi:hypothetical protein